MKGPIINGEEYRLVVLKVTGRDERLRPSQAQIGYDDTTFRLEGGEDFITAFVKADVVKPRMPS